MDVSGSACSRLAGDEGALAKTPADSRTFCGICSPPRGKRWKHSPVAVVTSRSPGRCDQLVWFHGKKLPPLLSVSPEHGLLFLAGGNNEAGAVLLALLSFVTAQTFLKGLSKSWRTFDLPSCGKAGGVWGCLLTVEDVFCVFLSHSHTYTRTEPFLVTRAWGLTTEVIQRGSHKEMGLQCHHPRPGTLFHLASAYLLANGEACVG